MCDLIVGKPDISVGFRLKKSTVTDQHKNSWDNRYTSSTSEGGGSKADTTISTPPSDLSSGMCVVRTQDTAEDTAEPTPTPSSGKTSSGSPALPTVMDVAIRCTAPNCVCDGFTPSKPQIRSCDACHHGWVAHALDKLGFRHLFNSHQVEMVQPTAAFDVASLMLYGTEAMPIRLKILLDRLFSVLQQEEVIHVLHGFGWTYEDYARGYILQDPRGQVLERWIMPTREEEPLILQQFLRFGETKPIAQQLLLQDSTEKMEQAIQGSRDYSDSDIKRFIQRTSRLMPMMPPGVSLALTQTSSASIVNQTSCPAKPNKPSSSVSSTTSLSPVTRSPINSPLSSSPLNKLQNMQPYDFRRDRNASPDTRENLMLQLPQQNSTPLPSPTTTSSSMITTTATPVSTFYSHTTTTTLSENYATSNNSSQYGGILSDFSATDEGSENDSEAINLSQHSHPHHQSYPGMVHSHLDSIYAAKKVRHLRKSANPMKRRWNPLMLSGLTTNPATGKKRVQCHVCLKTFCDKGALKIHFSAVHLREMHKCTVDGCNMMFSSRRSRNRHSANPNPKLHTPNLRRKLSHHDGRSSLPFPIIPPSTLMNFNSSAGGSNILPVHPSLSNERDREDRHSMNTGEGPTKLDTNIPSSTIDDPSPDGCSNRHQNVPFLHHRKTLLNYSDEVLSLTKRPRVELNGDISNDGDEGIDLTMKDTDNGNSSGNNKGVRKRKSFNPTKCAVTSDDDLQYVSTDDSSSDTFVDDNGILSKSDGFSSDLLEDDSKDDDVDKDSNPLPTSTSILPPSSLMQANSIQTNIPAHSSSKPEDKLNGRSSCITSFSGSTFGTNKVSSKDNDMVSLDLSSKHKDPIIKHNHDTEEVPESPLRHLETLSLGAFTGLLNHTKSTFSHHIESTTGISYHAPGLGLATSTSNIPDISRERRSHMPQTDSQAIPLPIPGSGLGISAGDSDPDGHMSMLPVYRDASMIGAVDVPVDKENPRRCIACGKIFQNHFGVKTHYQNVHLKLMHKCTVDGCNAAFPSKRSRDRHSANLNLHRKLLSTSADKGHYFDKGLFPFPPADYFPRIYDPQTLPLNFTDLYHGRFGENFLHPSPFGGPLGPAGSLGVMPPFHPAFMVPTTSTSGSSLMEGTTRISDGRDDTPISSISSTPSPRPKSSSPSSISPDKDENNRTGRRPLTLDSELIPDSEGRYSCKFCQRLFVDSAHLRDHYEGTHLPSLLPCPVDDCSKVFLSANDRDTHCDAENHHHHRAKREKTPPTS